ncbi:MAG: 4'-phosphopantetheinyl transferase superfamily protein [Clostridia bacterium]|nr:4'-phosphopantetheinyl transferase superfamily protein [Clostridia bacterium]
MNKTLVVLTGAGSNINSMVNNILKKKVVIERKESGAPYLEGSDLSFSLSHKEKLVCFAISPKAVGVDIEKIVEKDSIYGIAERYFGEPIEVGDALAFYTAWTRREALSKLVGTGLNKELLSTDLSSGEYQTDEGMVVFRSWEDEGYLITVACYDDAPEFKKDIKKQEE